MASAGLPLLLTMALSAEPTAPPVAPVTTEAAQASAPPAPARRAPPDSVLGYP